MMNRIAKFFLKPARESGPATNGKHNRALPSPAKARPEPFWRKQWQKLRMVRATRPGQPLKQLWRQKPMLLVNRGLLLLALFMTLAVFLFLWHDGKALAEKLQMPQAVAGTNDNPSATANQRNPSYSTVAARRRYFRVEVHEPVHKTANPLNASEVPGFTQRFTLLGILMGEVPQAIVRENSSNTTLFLTGGQSLDGYQVQEIFSDRVLLQRDGDLINLRM